MSVRSISLPLALALAGAVAPASADAPKADPTHRAGHETAAHADDHQQHAFEAAGVKIVHPWMNATRGRDALIFMTVENTGSRPVMIEGADAPFATRAALVGQDFDGGVAQAHPVPGVPVSPGRALVLEPDGLAVRVTGIDQPLAEGGHVPLTLRTSAGPIPVTVAIEAHDARDHSHAGHAH